LFGSYGLKKAESLVVETLWEAYVDRNGDFGLEEDEINLDLLLAECYDKGIGTDADPDACATVLSKLVFMDRKYGQSFDRDPKITRMIMLNYRDDVPEPRQATLLGRKTDLSEQQCAHYLFEKYKDEIEKRVNAEDAEKTLEEAAQNLPAPSWMLY
ncbi:MAG: hypothetical protein KBS45_01235, partial [Clostridiales bacterium]|nr:hypothetical protein [Candidatus Coliplasma caballi]